MRALIFNIILIFAAALATHAQATGGSLSGRVTDQLNAVIIGANVTLASATNPEKNVFTSGEGVFTFSNLAPGFYVLRVKVKGFALYERTQVEVVSGVRRELIIQMTVALEEQQVSVGGDGGLSTAIENNAAALRLRDSELEVLPDDPEELDAALRSMAGASVGLDGGQILIDGFANTGQPLPSRNSIREIRINDNPFSAENDRVGFGQIQIITRPGTENWRGSAYFNFSDESLNSRNPFAVNRAAYQMRNYGGSLSGPLVAKRVSFFASLDPREIDDNAVVNALILDENLKAVQLNRAVVTPRRQITFNSRFDAQLSLNHTLSARYSFFQVRWKNVGVGGFSLPGRGFNRRMPINTFQLTETAVIKSKFINEIRLQYIGEDRIDDDSNQEPKIDVLGSFTSGGAGIGLASNPEGRLTVQDSILWTAGTHTLRIGARLRRTTISDISPTDFNGVFTFGGGIAPRLTAGGEIIRDSNGQIISESITSLERYRRTLFFGRLGFSPSAIRVRGGGATQFARGGGNPAATAEQIDFGAYLQDDWRIGPTFTLAIGLRYEFQTNIRRNLNLAPRISFAWAPRFANKDIQKPVSVIRGGFGVFFDRFNEGQVLTANRFQSGDFFRYVTDNTAILDAYPVAPSIEFLRQTLPAQQTIWRIADDLRDPYMLQAAVSAERQLPFNTTISATFIMARALHALRTRNVNSPVIVLGPEGEIVGSTRPIANTGDIFQYESNGRFNQTQLVLTLNNRLSSRISFFANYTLNRAMSDTDGVGTFPADSYDLTGEYGRSASDVRHTFSAGGTFELPFKIRLNPLIFASSGRPYNITIGRDLNLDSLFTERPAFAVDLTKPGIVVTGFGAFDPNPLPGQQITPRNYGTSSAFLSANLSVSRTIKLGKAKITAGKQGEKPFNLLFGIRAINLFNRTNFASPVGNLTSPFFGSAVSTSGGFGAANIGNPAAGNRRIELQIRFDF